MKTPFDFLDQPQNDPLDSLLPKREVVSPEMPMEQQAPSTVDRYRELLNKYREIQTKPVGDDTALLAAQEAQRDATQRALYASAANQFSDAIAKGFGGNVEKNTDAVSLIQNQGTQALDNYQTKLKQAELNRQKDLDAVGFEKDITKLERDEGRQDKFDTLDITSKGLDISDKTMSNQLDSEMNNKDSDVSKLARTQAIKAFPKLAGQIEGLTAAQLEKLGFKFGSDGSGSSSGGSSFQQFSYNDPVSGTLRMGLVNIKSGDVVDAITKQPISPDATKGSYTQFRPDPNSGNLIALNPSSLKPIPNQVTGSEPIQKLLNEGKVKPEEVSVKMLNPKEYKKVEGFRKELSDNAFYKDSKKAYNAAQLGKSLIEMGKNGNSPVLLRAIQNTGARASGEVGAMTENDVRAFGGSEAIAEQIQQIFATKIDGTLTPKNVKFLNDYFKVMERNNMSKILEESNRIKNTLSQDFQIPDAAAATLLNLNDYVPKPRRIQKARYNPKTNQTQVIYTDGTKEILDGKM